MNVRALIIDDHVLFAEAIKPALASEGIEVVGVATTAAEGRRAVDELRPDLVLVDLGLPDESGLVLGRAIVDRHPDAKVVALTALEEPRAVRDAIRAGFHGYITKDTAAARFVQAVRAALDGQVVYPRRLAMRGGRTAAEENARLLASQLTQRERQVLALLAAGATGREIAARLSISTNTVRTHVQSILTKLQVHSRLEAAVFAMKHRILDDLPPPAAAGE
ncbi:MAG TPA: response regulator transcription factor [Actinomycetota bacterium]|nr:response regulator transcription factor [Actinomycetota bacterium]